MTNHGGHRLQAGQTFGALFLKQPGRGGASLSLRRRLALSTILAAIPVLAGGPAYADCVAGTPPTFVCSDTSSAPQTVTLDNADVSTAATPPFTVNTAGGNALSINGRGNIRFTDENASTLISTNGSGLSVTADGDIAGPPIVPGGVTVKTNGTITGSARGVSVINKGSGGIDITADGQVTGTKFFGIVALNEDDSRGDLKITTGASSVVTGGAYGIAAVNKGDGKIDITANGTVIGQSGSGIYANILVDAEGLKITTGAGSSVAGKVNGISAVGQAFGDMTISVGGDVVGTERTGIYAMGNASMNAIKITTEAGSVVKGRIRGIVAESNSAAGGGIDITVRGEVTGLESDDNPMMSQAGFGIDAYERNIGAIKIKVESTGLVQGDAAGIMARSQDGTSATITNYGEVRNITRASADLAITTANIKTDLDNRGTLIGQVEFNKFDDTLKNAGTWNAAGGSSEFGSGQDSLSNSGVFIAAADAASLETTRLAGLETFENDGLITLADGQAGDVLEANGGLAEILYEGGVEGGAGRLAVDAVLGGAGTGLSDEFVIVNGGTDGTTRVAVNIVDVLGGNEEGIPVVRLDAGNKRALDGGSGHTSEEDFDLENGPFNAGFFIWDLRLDAQNNWQELYSAAPGAGAFEFAAGITGAQDIWQQTTGLLLQRQADLRPLLDGTAVTPAADAVLPAEPSPLARVTPGFWFKGVGAWLERDEGDGLTRLDRDQTIYGGLGGLDFGSESGGQAWMFGLFGGYLVSDLDFDQTGSKWTYEGPTAGAYATYLNQAFYVDVVVKADLLDIDIDEGGLTPGAGDAGTDLFNIGGVIDAGYKFGFGDGAFLEPQAALAVVRSEIDDVGIFGGTVDFEDETSLRGRLGLRAGMDRVGAGGTVYSADVTASLWQEFNDGNGVTISSPGIVSEFGVVDDPGGTVGDLSVGLSIAGPEGWSGFLRGNYQLAEDFEAIVGNAGLRFAW